MKKVNLLKKIIPISGIILIVLYLMDEYMMLLSTSILPFSKELNLVNCKGVGFAYFCRFNIKGWIVLSVLVLFIVSIIVYLLSLRNNKKS